MITKTVSIYDARKQLSELLKLALEGNDVIIVENNKPLARLVPISEDAQPRTAGLNKGKIWVSEDFDDPLPEEFWTGSK